MDHWHIRMTLSKVDIDKQVKEIALFKVAIMIIKFKESRILNMLNLRF